MPNRNLYGFDGADDIRALDLVCDALWNAKSAVALEAEMAEGGRRALARDSKALQMALRVMPVHSPPEAYDHVGRRSREYSDACRLTLATLSGMMAAVSAGSLRGDEPARYGWTKRIMEEAWRVADQARTRALRGAEKLPF